MKLRQRRPKLEAVQLGSLLRVWNRSEEWLQVGIMLRRLRQMTPSRPLTQLEALSIAERQATRVLGVLGVDTAPVPLEVVEQLSRIEVAYVANIPVAGASVYGRGAWRITVEASLAEAEQRMVVAHEFKHVVDYTRTHARYIQTAVREPLADYFARCLFMPRPWVKQLVAIVGADARRLAELFVVPPEEARLRLIELGLADTPSRLRRGVRWRRRGRVSRRRCVGL